MRRNPNFEISRFWTIEKVTYIPRFFDLLNFLSPFLLLHTMSFAAVIERLLIASSSEIAEKASLRLAIFTTE